MKKREVEWRDDRLTPNKVLVAVRKFGPIGCDPCTMSDNPTGARFFYTIDSVSVAKYGDETVYGGLKADWTVMPHEVVFVHPPWAKGPLKSWLDAISSNAIDALAKSGTNIVAFLPGSTTSSTTCRCLDEADAVCMIRQRVKCASRTDDKCERHGAERPSLLAYWGDEPARFASAVQHLGPVFRARKYDGQ